MRSLVLIALFCAIPALAEEHHTVAWYHAHPAETLAKLSACNNDPGYARHDANCESAHEARLAMSVDEGRAQMGLIDRQQDAQRRAELRANPQTLLDSLKYCNGLDTYARRVMKCDMVYGEARQYVAANKGAQR